MRIVKIIVWIIGIGLSLVTLLGYMGCCWIPLDLFSHFRFHYILLLLPVIAFFVWKKQWWAVLFFLLPFGLNAYAVGSLFYAPPTINSSINSSLSLLSINVNYQNRSYQAVLDEITDNKSDLVVFQEYTPKWHQAISAISKDYPYETHIFKENNFGLAVWSKYPISDTLIHYFADINTPTLEVSILTEELPFNLFAFHPPAPVDPNFGPYARDYIFRDLSAYLLQHPNPHRVLIGDFNATPYSYPFIQLLKQTKLQNSQKGFGLQHSWGGQLAPLGIGIDHCLHSSNMQTLSREIGPYVGSDHRGVWVELGY